MGMPPDISNIDTLDRILVIKLGALGDFIQALGPFAAIRSHHARAEITLLTRGPFVDFIRPSGYFDDIWADTKPGPLQIAAGLELRRGLREGGFDRVYDLQTSERSSFYYRLFWPGPYPQWSGIADGCSHPHANPNRDVLHTEERQAEQLAQAGIVQVPAADLSWVEADTDRFGLDPRFALLVAGGAAHRPAKRWPAARYGALAGRLAAAGVTPVLLGSVAEADVIGEVAAACPAVRNLASQTDFADIAVLARSAVCAVGNDTGPMHIIAASGCPSVVLYSHESNPELCGQRGPKVDILRRENLESLDVDDVFGALRL